MPRFEYKVVPAPKKGVKAKRVRSTADRFALALEIAMNDLGAEGWEYQRTDTLPCEERSGLTGKTTGYQNMLVFRREIPGPKSDPTLPMKLGEPLANTPKRSEPVFRRAEVPGDVSGSDNPSDNETLQLAPETETHRRIDNHTERTDDDAAPDLPGQRRADSNITT